MDEAASAGKVAGDAVGTADEAVGADEDEDDVGDEALVQLKCFSSWLRGDPGTAKPACTRQLAEPRWGLAYPHAAAAKCLSGKTQWQLVCCLPSTPPSQP